MFGVNPFDQPGVEAYKKNLRELLELNEEEDAVAEEDENEEITKSEMVEEDEAIEENGIIEDTEAEGPEGMNEGAGDDTDDAEEKA